MSAFVVLVEWPGSIIPEVLASFDTLEEAIRFKRTKRGRVFIIQREPNADYTLCDVDANASTN